MPTIPERKPTLAECLPRAARRSGAAGPAENGPGGETSEARADRFRTIAGRVRNTAARTR